MSVTQTKTRTPSKFGWCRGHEEELQHEKCWRVSTTGARCACECHIGEPEDSRNQIVNEVRARGPRPPAVKTAKMKGKRIMDVIYDELGNPIETPKRAKKVKTPLPCACGCGGLTAGGKYLPGHDARHIKQLVAAAITGVTTESAALEALDGSPRLQEKLLVQIERTVNAQKAREEKAAAKEQERAAKAEARAAKKEQARQAALAAAELRRRRDPLLPI